MSVLKVESVVCSAGLVRHSAYEVRPLLLGLRLGAWRGLRVELREDAHDSCGDFVVNNGLVVFADDINTKFLEGRKEA